MDERVPEPTVVQGAAGSSDGSRAHHRDGHGVLPFSSNGGREGKEEGRLNPAVAGRTPPVGRRRPCVDRAGFKTKIKTKNFLRKENQDHEARDDVARPVGRRRRFTNGSSFRRPRPANGSPGSVPNLAAKTDTLRGEPANLPSGVGHF